METTTLVVAVMTVLAFLVAAPAAGIATVDDAQTVQDTLLDSDEQHAQANETAPGERLSGVVSVSEAEFEGDLDQRTFGIKLAQAESQEAQADVLNETLQDVEQRLTELEERKASLQDQRNTGEISEGKYRADIARMAAESQTAQQLTNQSAQAAGELPTEILDERGVNVTAIQTLQDRANELTGPEIAAIAQEIAGPAVGDTPAQDRPVEVPDRPERPGDAGPPGDDEDDEAEQGAPDDTPADE